MAYPRSRFAAKKQISPRKAGKIRIAIDLGVPPYGMTDEKLQPTGLDVEAARLLGKDWGLEFVTLWRIRYRHF